MSNIQLPPFNKDYWIFQFKKECGLPDIAYEDLHLYEVDFDSPFGRTKYKKNAKEYVDEQLAYAEKTYEETKNTGDTSKWEEIINSTIIEEQPKQLLPAIDTKQQTTNILFYEVNVDFNNQLFKYVVFINLSHPEATTQVELMKISPYLVRELPEEEVKNTDNIISYYQYYNMIISKPKPKKDYTEFEDLLGTMNTMFDGLKMDGLRI